MRHSMKSELSVYYQNVGGLRTKLQNLHKAVNSCSYDVILLTETWLNSDIKERNWVFLTTTSIDKIEEP